MHLFTSVRLSLPYSRQEYKSNSHIRGIHIKEKSQTTSSRRQIRNSSSVSAKPLHKWHHTGERICRIMYDTHSQSKNEESDPYPQVQKECLFYSAAPWPKCCNMCVSRTSSETPHQLETYMKVPSSVPTCAFIWTHARENIRHYFGRFPYFR